VLRAELIIPIPQTPKDESPTPPTMESSPLILPSTQEYSSSPFKTRARLFFRLSSPRPVLAFKGLSTLGRTIPVPFFFFSQGGFLHTVAALFFQNDPDRNAFLFAFLFSGNPFSCSGAVSGTESALLSPGSRLWSLPDAIFFF